MDIRSIAVHLDLGEQTEARVAAAAALARRYEAHLTGVAPSGWTLSPSDTTCLLGARDYLDATQAVLQEQARDCVQRFEAQVRSLGLSAWEGRVASEDTIEAMTLAARYSDLCIVTQTDPSRWSSGQQAGMPETVLLNAGRPLLVIPHSPSVPVVMPPDGRVLLAWDGGREAARAALDALPLLKRAREVEVMVFVPLSESHDPRHGPLPGAEICLWLARHGLKSQATRAEIEMPVGAALLSHAAAVGAQLIVAGGYGHSRLRETVLGGVTRTLLRHATVPVLLSH